MNRKSIISIVIASAIVVLFFCNLFYGTVSIPASAVMDILSGKEAERAVWTPIILQSRLPQAITALLAGGALAVCGLMLQTLFQNPLAGPSVLGITNGANLGVALVMLYSGNILGSSSTFSLGTSLSVVLAAFAGAFGVLLLILYLSSKVKSNILVLIIGMMVGYLASSAISVLNSYASADNVRAFVMWGMGNFSSVSLQQLPFFAGSLLLGLFMSVLLIKPLNALLLGERYAANLGINIQRTRISILLITGLLIAITTAYCGPVSFIGLAVPHIARLVLGTSNQNFLLPATILSGSCIALLCNLLTIIPFGKGLIPLNAVTPLLGAPVILYIILSRRNAGSFN